jgi:hypothetical protein
LARRVLSYLARVEILRLVRAFRAAAQIHHNHASRIKLDYSVGALVHNPQVVIAIESHRVGVTKPVDPFA